MAIRYVLQRDVKFVGLRHLYDLFNRIQSVITFRKQSFIDAVHYRHSKSSLQTT